MYQVAVGRLMVSMDKRIDNRNDDTQTLGMNHTQAVRIVTSHALAQARREHVEPTDAYMARFVDDTVRDADPATTLHKAAMTVRQGLARATYVTRGVLSA